MFTHKIRSVFLCKCVDLEFSRQANACQLYFKLHNEMLEFFFIPMNPYKVIPAYVNSYYINKNPLKNINKTRTKSPRKVIIENTKKKIK